jgi:hypothetical protein
MTDNELLPLGGVDTQLEHEISTMVKQFHHVDSDVLEKISPQGPGKPLLYLMIRYFSQKEWQVGSSLRFLHEYIMKMQQVNRMF